MVFGFRGLSFAKIFEIIRAWLRLAWLGFACLWFGLGWHGIVFVFILFHLIWLLVAFIFAFNTHISVYIPYPGVAPKVFCKQGIINSLSMCVEHIIIYHSWMKYYSVFNVIFQLLLPLLWCSNGGFPISSQFDFWAFLLKLKTLVEMQTWDKWNEEWKKKSRKQNIDGIAWWTCHLNGIQ